MRIENRESKEIVRIESGCLREVEAEVHVHSMQLEAHHIMVHHTKPHMERNQETIIEIDVRQPDAKHYIPHDGVLDLQSATDTVVAIIDQIEAIGFQAIGLLEHLDYPIDLDLSAIQTARVTNRTDQAKPRY